MKLLMIDNYDSFTYNLVHLFEELGAEVVTRPQRRDHASTRRRPRARPARHLPRPGTPGGRGRLGRADPGGSARRRRRSASASATRRSSRRSAARSARRRRSCTARRASSPTTGAGSTQGLPDELEVGRYHSLAATDGARRADGHRADGRRRGDGRPPCTSSRSRASSSTRRASSRRSARDAREELPRGDHGRRSRGSPTAAT